MTIGRRPRTCRGRTLSPLALLSRLTLVPALAAILAPGVASSQELRWEMDLNGSRIQYDTLAAMNAPSLASSLEWRGRTLMARAGGSLTSFQNNGESLQGRAELVGWFSPAGASSPLRLEVGGAVGGSRHSGGFDTFVAQGDLRLHVQGTRAGAWAGVGMATSRNSFDTASLGSAAPNVGAWVRLGPARLIARYTDQRVGGERFPEASLATVYSRGALDLTAFAGYRQSPFSGVGDDTWAGASAALWRRSNRAVLVSGGTYAPDIVQGIPGGEFFSVGIRISPPRRRALVPLEPLPLAFTSEDTRSGGLGFRVEGASRVEVAGDWNGWQPVPLRQDGAGRWVIPADLAPGVYRFNLRIDGTTWVVPSEVPSVDDGFGGQVGILVISEG